MRKRLISTLLTSAVALLLCVAAAPAQENNTKYKEYQPKSTTTEYFEISFDEERVSVGVFDSIGTTLVSLPREQLKLSGENRLQIDSGVYFDEGALYFDGRDFPYDNITETIVTERDEEITITFFTLEGDVNRLDRVRRGNRISFNQPILVEKDIFVRGGVFSVAGNLEIFGEVNKDVITLLGNVYIGPAAVARGDVTTINGEIEIADEASVYGELYSATDYLTKRRHRFYGEEGETGIIGGLDYNRVDGATPRIGVKYHDIDSVLPTAWVEFGYALESERWRLTIGLEQTLLRSRPLSIGGSYYQRLASEDDWLLAEHENTIFTLLVTEDFKDYWEGRGGLAWVNFSPLKDLEFRASYRYEETNWLRSYRHLWSLFGGDKRFPRNFHRVPEPFRSQGIRDIDTTTNGALGATLDWDTHDQGDPFSRSGWHLTGNLEWSHPDLNSDFDYRRYTVMARRYQRINRQIMILARVAYGGSDGLLPMHKRFYLGGLGTLRGYKHKELMGTRFWMANFEYRFAFPKTDLAASLIWDVGQIANDRKLDSDIEVKHSLGVGLALGDEFRVNIAKRLDRASDDTPRTWVRFEHVF